jgi:hypothetical protein
VDKAKGRVKRGADELGHRDLTSPRIKQDKPLRTTGCRG